MKVTIQKIANVPLPARAHDTDAGLDLYIPDGRGCLVRPGDTYLIDLGVRVAIPDGYYGQLTLRSSAGAKGLTIPHGVGVIDSGYRGNLKILLAAIVEPVMVAAGESICQLIILPLPPVDMEVGVVDDSTDRGAAGFGSTGIEATDRHYATSRGADLTNDRKNEMDGRTHLTVGDLMSELQKIAFQYGNDTPVVVPTTADADYEQAATPIVMHARREPVPDDWDLFHIDPTGEGVVVLS